MFVAPSSRIRNAAWKMLQMARLSANLAHTTISPWYTLLLERLWRLIPKIAIAVAARRFGFRHDARPKGTGLDLQSTQTRRQRINSLQPELRAHFS